MTAGTHSVCTDKSGRLDHWVDAALVCKARIKHFIFFFFCLTLMFHSCPVAAEDFKIIKISPAGGFTFEAINSISEDKFGFIWFGSNSGLYRYNSLETVKFINSPEDKTTLPGNSIRSLYLDRNKELWISTSSGLCRFDSRLECFKRYQFHDASGNPGGLNVSQLLQTADSAYWLVDARGLAKIDFRTGTIAYLTVPPVQKDEPIRVVFKDDHEERMWLGGRDGGIYCCDPPYRSISFFARVRPETVNAILHDGNKVWAAYEWGGADVFDASGTLSDHYGDNMQGNKKIPSSRVKSIVRYKNEIWLGTFKGLVRIKADGVEFVEKEKYPGLQSNSIYQIYSDSRNGIWIGTWSGGLSYINEWSNSIEHYKREPYANSLSDNVVCDFEELPDGKIVVATEEGNLNTLNLADNSFTLYRIPWGNGWVNHFKTMHTDKRGTLWVGTFASGIFYKPAGSNVYKHFDLIDNDKDQFFDITSDNDGVWFGSSARGLFYYDYQTGRLNQYVPKSSDPESISSTAVRALLHDSRGNLWVGTVNGLNVKEAHSEKFKRFFYNQDRKNRISNNLIYSLMEDSKGNIWIGTSSGGVNIFNPATETFTQFSRKEGLAGNDVYGILEDETGIVWMSTENGISAYSGVTGKFRNFDYADGLQGNQFNPGAAFKSRRGDLYFGGANGFNRFDPKQMKENPVIPKAYITGLEINNEIVNVEGRHGIIHQSLLTLDKLELQYNQNSLSFELAANNFLLPQKNRFKYRLTGYSPDWIEIEKANNAIFTKIPPGTYTFEVMAANNDGVWNTTPTRLPIVIHTPIWKSGYAILLYIVLLVTIIYLLLRELRLRDRLESSILHERMQRENEEKLHQLKLQFFTNISHEFRTPLTLILSPLSILKKKNAGQAEQTEHLTLIENNANRLLRLVNQLLDIRKIELGKINFQPQPFDIVALCREVFQCFSLQENDRKIRFIFESDYASLFISIEPDKIDKLIFNLLSNAMKHSVPGGTIQLSVKSSNWKPDQHEPLHHLVGEPIIGEQVTIVVRNDGHGIAGADLPHIFDRFYQSPGQITGTGIGLHLCSEYIQLHKGQLEVFTGENMGATFFVNLPITRKEIEKGIEETISQTVSAEDLQESAGDVTAPTGRSDREPKILVVEDNKEMQGFLRSILSENYRVIVANDGEEGLKFVRESGPDLVLTDVMMPGISGNEFCHILKTDLNTSHIPVIMLTALSSVENQLEGFETGADDYIVKPFDDRILLSRIKNQLDARALMREKFTHAHEEWHDEMQKFKPDKELLDLATEVIGRHLVDINFSVDVLASELNLSRSSLHRKLRALTDQSATEFIKFVRINKSIQLIEQGETNIDEICFKVGFNSHSYYSMCFKKQLGVTPSEYISRFKRDAKK